MHTVAMKRVVIIGDCDLEQKMFNEIRELGATGYTIFHSVQGQGERGIRPRHAVSGNIKIEVIATAEVAEQIPEHVAKNYFDNDAMIGFLDDVEVLYGEKFGATLER